MSSQKKGACKKYIRKGKNFALFTQNLGIEVKTFSPDPRQAEETLGFRTEHRFRR
jgi:hypothetical protein